MKKGILIAAVALLAGEAFAQKSDLTSAILSYRKQDMPTAKKYIDQADVKLSEGGTLKAKDNSKFLYHKGLVYFSLSQDTTVLESQRIEFLDTAVSAYLLDTETTGTSYYKKSKVELIRCAYSYGTSAYDKFDAKEYSKALSLFEKVVNVNGSNAIGKVDTSNIFNASLMAVQAKDSEKSIELLSRLLELDPSNGEYHMSLVKEYGKVDNAEAQLAALKNGRILAPNNTGLIFEEVNYYLAQNDNDALLKSLDVAIIAAPDNKILQFAKGMALGNLKKYEEAKLAYQAAIAIDADYFDAYNNLAGLFLDQTVALIEKMNSLGLSDADQRKYSSIKKKRNNLYAAAKPYLEEAVRINDTAVEVLSALKEVCYQTDDIDCWKKTNNRIKELQK
jgi:tetratricopeptide (TPR) repeat protein